MQQQPGQYYKGQLKQFTPKRKTPDAFSREMPMGRAGDFYTKLRLYAKAPSLEWPTASLFLQMANGNAKTYARISLEELREIGAWIAQCIVAYEPLAARLAVEENALLQYQQVVSQQQDKIRQAYPLGVPEYEPNRYDRFAETDS